MYKAEELITPDHTIAGEYLKQFDYIWQAIPGIKDEIIRLGSNLDESEYEKKGENIWIHKTAKVAPTAFIGSPAIIGPGTEVRHCAFIRGSALVGSNCVVGNSVELKNVILCDDVQVPHFNYVGDSILGYKSHMGAGSITSNVKQDKTEVTVKSIMSKEKTGLIKFGAILGDNVEIGCNCVLNPGTVIGKNSHIYPLVSVRGYIQANLIVKGQNQTVKLREVK